MRYVLKNQEMQTVDHETIHGIGIPGLVLMERASKAVADKAAQIADHSQRILIISGIGNNGGPVPILWPPECQEESVQKHGSWSTKKFCRICKRLMLKQEARSYTHLLSAETVTVSDFTDCRISLRK